MTPLDSPEERVVVVAAGFGLWHGRRCLTSARWSDVARLFGYVRSPEGGPTCLTIELRAGSVHEISDQTPGWPAFIDHAHRLLSGMPPAGQWTTDVARAPYAGNRILLFERRALGGPKLPRR